MNVGRRFAAIVAKRGSRALLTRPVGKSLFHSVGLDISTRSPGAAVVDILGWKPINAIHVKCKGSNTAEDFHETAMQQTELVRALASDQIAIWTIEDFMRQFLPGMSHSRGMFSLAQLNAVVSHSIRSQVGTPLNCLHTPVHVMPNRIRALFGVDDLVKTMEHSAAGANMQKTPKSRLAAARKERVKVAAAAACLRAFPYALDHISPKTKKQGVSDVENRPSELAEYIPDSAVLAATKAIASNVGASDVADAVLVAAYGGVVALEAGAMLGLACRYRYDADHVLLPRQSSGPVAEALWDAAGVSTEHLLAKRFHSLLQGNDEHGPQLQRFLETVFVGASARLLGIRPSTSVAVGRTSSELHSANNAALSATRSYSPSSALPGVLLSSVHAKVALTVLGLQPGVSMLALGAEAVSTAKDPLGVKPDSESAGGKKSKRGKKVSETTAAPSSGSARCGKQESEARNAIALAFRNGQQLRSVLEAELGQEIGVVNAPLPTVGGTHAADVLIAWLGTPTGKAVPSGSPSSVAAATRISSALRKWARGIRAAAKRAVQEPQKSY